MGSSDASELGIKAKSHLTFQKWATGLLLIVGVEFWLVLGKGNYGTPRQWWPLLVALLLSIIGPIAKAFTAQLDRWRHPLPRTRRWITLIVIVLSTLYFLFTAHEQGRVMRLKYLDEQSYSIGMHMAARGRLWMPEHRLADFFEALELIVHPVYASIYFPGTAMLYAPSVWLRVPFWIWSAILAGICVGLTYRITAELVDSVAGLLCVLILIGSSIFRLVSLMLLSQTPTLLLALLGVYAWLRWRRAGRWGWALALGIFGGWCVITRPLDALALLLPIALAFLVDASKKPRRLFTTAAAMIGGAMPFLIIQLIFNIGVTGSWKLTPFQLSQERDYPQTSLGFHEFNPQIKPASSLPQKLNHYAHFTTPFLMTHQLATAVPEMMYEWLPRLLRIGLPSAFLLLVLPCGLLGAATNRRWIPLLGLPIWIILYAFYVFQLEHYIVVVLPLLALAIVCGVERIRTSWPSLCPYLTSFLTLAVAALCLANLAEFNRTVRDEWWQFAELPRIDQTLASVAKPAVVLFKYDPTLSSEEEPVYNTDVAWPDDAPVIRAHDLGPRDIELFRYYGLTQPNRSIYLYDRHDGSIRLLGTAKELAHAN